MTKKTPLSPPTALRPCAQALVYPNGSLVTRVELTYNSTVKASQRPLIKGSLSAFEFFLRYWDMSKIDLLEQFVGVYLNAGGRVLAIANISAGGIGSVTVDCRHVMAIALELNAVSIICCHNHPGGHPALGLRPSIADDHLTKKLDGCAGLLDIKLLDHIILCKEGYFSYADEGLLSLHGNCPYPKKVTKD